MKCKTCGLPMSILDDASNTNYPIWYCDGPNTETDQKGCYSWEPMKEEVPQREL